MLSLAGMEAFFRRFALVLGALALVGACARNDSFSNDLAATATVQTLLGNGSGNTSVPYAGDCPTQDLRSSSFESPLPAINVAATAIAYNLFDSTTPQPWGEAGTSFCPVILLLPSGTAKIDVLAAGSWTYEESVSERYNASGDSSTVDDPDTAYARDGIAISTGFPLASLVGLFSDGVKTSPYVASSGLKTIFEIGAAKTLTVPSGATLLALAFQDGYQWNNNTGSASATITLHKAP